MEIIVKAIDAECPESETKQRQRETKRPLGQVYKTKRGYEASLYNGDWILKSDLV